jgi:hypothetical protein
MVTAAVDNHGHVIQSFVFDPVTGAIDEERLAGRRGLRAR